MRVLKNNISKFLLLAFTVWSCLFLAVCFNNKNSSDSSNTNTDDVDPSSYSVRVKNNFHPRNVGSIWANMSQKLKLDHKTGLARVRSEIHRIQSNPDDFYHTLEAAAPYIYFIYKQTQSRGLPAELALIPIIESEFDPNNRTGSALGLWQLMPQTASELGVKVNWNYDGRRDVVASTKAALAYFNDLGRFFHGNWYLAIAAYNCGQYRVQSAQRNTGSKSFWELPLPADTRVYVPRLLAIAEVIKNPKKYGVQLPPVKNLPYFTEVKLQKSVNLNHIAKTTGISIHTLHALNPDYKDNQIVSKKGTYKILVPTNKVSAVQMHYEIEV